MRSQDRNVVLVKPTVNLKCWKFGMGREWGRVEKGEVSLRATWDQGGQDRFTSKEGFQVSKREVNREASKESKKGNCAITYVVNLYMCI
jgi:hypothetical protein